MTRSDRRPRQRLDPTSRRDAILAAAADAFAGAAYDDVAVATLAAAAGASQALVYRYFPTKADLYAAVVRYAVDDLVAAQGTVLDALPEGLPVRERLRAAALVYLDHVADHPTGWAAPLRGSPEPDESLAVRRAARARYVQGLAAMLAPDRGLRHEYALWGYFGFLDAALLHWVELGCPPEHRHPILDAALGALEGALGDWDA